MENVKQVAELWKDFVSPEVDHPEWLLSFRFTQADLHIASENSRQQGRNPNTFLGTSSTHKIPEIMGRKGIFHTTVSKNPVPAL